MVIGFTNDRVWNFLVKYGYVSTFRPKRKNPNTKTWVNRGRGEPKDFDCLVTELGKVRFGEDEKVMHHFVESSSFPDIYQWKNAIINLHGDLPEEGYIYLVKKL